MIIEKGKVPPRQRWIPQRLYPFADMAIGDSFVVPSDQRRKVAHAASMYRSRHPPWTFLMGLDDEGQLRLWRVDDTPLYCLRNDK
jgi:hypothetical protein